MLGKIFLLFRNSGISTNFQWFGSKCMYYDYLIYVLLNINYNLVQWYCCLISRKLSDTDSNVSLLYLNYIHLFIYENLFNGWLYIKGMIWLFIIFLSSFPIENSVQIQSFEYFMHLKIISSFTIFSSYLSFKVLVQNFHLIYYLCQERSNDIFCQHFSSSIL